MQNILLYPINIDKIDPTTRNFKIADQGGSKLVVIGKPGTGKTTLVSSLIYEKRHILPSGMVMSGTEDSNGYYSKMFPDTFIYNKFRDDILEKYVERQKIAKKHLKNPWSLLLMDDVCDDVKMLNKPIMHNLFKNGRHYKMFFILSLQYALDIKPSVRTNIDGVFILREPNIRNRKIIYDNYAGIIPDFATFCKLMDVVTQNYTALYIHNQTQSNRMEDCVFFYRAKKIPANFKFGNKDYWDFHYARRNFNS